VPDVPNSQGATISFAGTLLGVLTGFTPSFSAGNVHEFTGVRSPVVGTGQNARVVKQYTCTSIEPGTVTARFLGAADLARNDVGRPGALVVSWPGGALTGQAFLTDLQAEFARGELRQWAATFQFSGFDS
jgi:hypothetical protein